MNRVVSGEKITLLARTAPVAPNINSYKLYHFLRSQGHQRLAWDSRWPGEASLRRWRSVEATSYSLSCSSLLSAWRGARSLRLLVLVVVVSKFQSWNLKAFALRFTPHTVSWQASWQACSLGWVTEYWLKHKQIHLEDLIEYQFKDKTNLPIINVQIFMWIEIGRYLKFQTLRLVLTLLSAIAQTFRCVIFLSFLLIKNNANSCKH